MTEEKSRESKFSVWYEKNHRKLLILPAILVIASVIILANVYLRTGDIMEKDVTLKGGLTVTIQTGEQIDEAQLEKALEASFSDASVRRISEFGTDKQIGVIAEVATENEPAVKEVLAKELGVELSKENYSAEMTGSALGISFYKQMMAAIAVSFLLMALVIFIIFRSFIPSIAVVLAAFFDIVITLAVVNVIGLEVSTTGISAFLLLIGYSIDTDVLQTTRILKQSESTAIASLIGAMKTGLTMTIATIAALVIGLLVSTSIAIHEMFLIMTIGMLVDVITTYAMNAPILLMHVERKH